MEQLPPLRGIVTFEDYRVERYGEDGWADRQARLEAMARDDAWLDRILASEAVAVVDAWSYRGRDCLVTNYRNWHYEGYARCPDLAAARDGRERRGAIDVHGGVTTVTPTGWFGFETGHEGDVCVDHRGDPLPGGVAREVFPRPRHTTWTPCEAVAETERLVDELLTLGVEVGVLRDDTVPERPGRSVP